MGWEIERIPVGESEFDKLKEKYNQLQKDYDSAVKMNYHHSYIVENQKKRIEDIGKTLKLFEAENRAMRELLRQWI